MPDPVNDVGARLYQMDFITPEQSLTLMSERMGRALEQTEREEVLKLAKTAGYLRIALKLIAARVVRKTPLSDLSRLLEQEVVRLETLSDSHRPRKEETRLEACLNLSLNALRKDDLEEWQDFVWLGVLPDDAIVAAPMAATLWGVKEAEAAERLELLCDDALLLPSSPIQVGKRTCTAYRLHQLLHDVARRLLTTQTTGLGISLAQAHAELLKRYQVRRQSELWHTLADDGYIHAHLTWHLEQAGWVDEIHKLLREETSGRNGWYEACDRLEQTAIFASDVALAWRLAEDLFEESPSRAIALQCRYALIVSILNSLSANSTPTSLATLLQKYVGVPKGLDYALQSSDPQTQVSLLTEISDYLPQDLKEEALQKALAATKAIQYEQDRLNALKILVPKLPPGLLREALAIARIFPSGINRVEGLKALAPKLPPDLLPAALAIAQAFRYSNSEYCRALALSALASGWSEVIPEALAAARAVQNKVFGDNLSEELQAQALQEANLYRAGALTAIVDFLPDKLQAEVLQEALTAARTSEEGWRRAIALSALADKLPDKLQAEVLQEALFIARADEDDWSRAITLSNLASKLPPNLLQEALIVARDIQSEGDRVSALIALAFKLPEVIPEAFAAVREIQSRHARASALSALAPKLPPDLLPEALAIARTIRFERDRGERASVLIALASQMSRMQTGELLHLWQNILHSLSLQSRRNFLHDMLALASAICALGDRAAVAEVVIAIQDVGRWWP